MERGRACPGRNTCHLDGPTPPCCRLGAWPGCCSWVPFACFARAAMHAKLSRFYLNLFFFLLFVEWGDYMYVCFSRVWKTLEGNELVHDQSMVVLIWASQLPLCVHFLSFFFVKSYILRLMFTTLLQPTWWTSTLCIPSIALLHLHWHFQQHQGSEQPR